MRVVGRLAWDPPPITFATIGWTAEISGIFQSNYVLVEPFVLTIPFSLCLSLLLNSTPRSPLHSPSQFSVTVLHDGFHHGHLPHYHCHLRSCTPTASPTTATTAPTATITPTAAITPTTTTTPTTTITTSPPTTPCTNALTPLPPRLPPT